MNRLLRSLAYRYRWWKKGVLLLTPGSHSIDRISIRGKKRPLHFLTEEQEHSRYEFHEIYFDDVYRLESLPETLKTVVDIGANIGMFTLAAHWRFPSAEIHSVEPNPTALEILKLNHEGIPGKIHECAVGSENRMVSLTENPTTLGVAVRPDEHGKSLQIAFRDLVNLFSDGIDLLKLDCEGAEWQILTDDESMRRVRFLTMEYHLNTPGALGLQTLTDLLNRQGFQNIEVRDKPSSGIGFLTAHR